MVFNPPDDPNVKEVTVYLSKAVNCYMFQYPVKPTSMTYDDSVVVKARFRANNQQVQLEVVQWLGPLLEVLQLPPVML